MKCILFAIVCLFSSCFLTHGQDITAFQADSIQNILHYAGELNDKSKYGESIKIAKQSLLFLKDTDRYRLLGKAHNSLSYSYAELKDKDKAFDNSFKARDYFIKSQDTTSIIVIYNNIGVTYEDFGMIEESIDAYKHSLELAESFKDDESSVYPSYNIGNNLVRYQKKYEEALPYFYKVITLVKAAKFKKDDHIYGDVYSILGYVNYKLKRFKESERYYKKALDLVHRNNYLPALQSIYEDKVNLYREDKDFANALLMMDKYVEITDSINKVNNVELAKTIEAQYKIKESEEKLSFIEKEKEIQAAQLLASKRNSILLAILSALLILTTYWIIKKNKELKISRDVAENLSRVKSDFYSEISHELRTPLYGVIELSNILLNENVNDKNKEYLESLKFSGGHLLSLINNVLELNKMESGLLAVEEIEFDLKVLITNIIDSLEYALRDSNNQIKLLYDESISDKLIGDSLKLSQLLINLISNAVKFTKNGIIEVHIKQVIKNKDKEELYFAIKDDGIGIPLDKQKSIFDDFYQERLRHDNSYKGTGLGLSIVKRLLTIMGSDISIESELNKGAKFYFNLAFKNEEKLQLTESKVHHGITELKGMCFLVVDDNKINQLVTKKILHQLELECDVVDDGHKAIHAVKQKTYDCVLMDLNMPGMNGYEATQRIRYFNQDIVIVALTAATSEEVKKNIIFYDMDGYVLKPFYTEDFLKTVGNSISNRSRIDRGIA